jgi:uncharacterized protein (TIGR00252 family)
MTTTSTGRLAEKIASDYLNHNGHHILSLNWRTRFCEIDIVSQTKDIVYFSEVKYRQNASWGDGLEAIGAKKLKQMELATRFWASSNNYEGDMRLLAINMTGIPPKIIDIIEL